MAPRSEHNAHKDYIVGQDPSTKGTHKSRQVIEERRKMTVIEKIMLNAQLWGMEAACDLEHLYTVPTLQMLGMPLSLVSLTGLVAGPSAMMLLPFTGWLTDRGSNPYQRKTAAIIFASLVYTIGLSCVAAANMLHLSYLLDYDERKDIAGNNSLPWTVLKQSEPASNVSFNVSDVPVKDFGNEIDTGIQTSSDLLLSSEGLGLSTNASHTVTNTENSSGVPFKAALSMVGFILLDIGYDLTNGHVKSYVLTCSPRSEQTSVLILGLIMASAGGVSTAFLGIVDLTSFLGISNIEGASLVVQTSIQCLVVMFFVVFATIITLISGRRQLKRNEQYATLTSDLESSFSAVTEQDDQFTSSTRTITLESSIRSFGGGSGAHFDSSLALLHEDQNLFSEQTPLLAEDESFRNKGDFVESYTLASSVSHNTKDSIFNHSEQPTSFKATLEDVPEEQLLHTNMKSTRTVKTCKTSGFKIKIVFICISTYFSLGVIIYYTLTSSDLVGKAIYGGDPNAAAGSEGLARYQEGLRMASRGFLVYYGTFLLISFVHPRILAFLGYRMEFVLTNLLMAMAMLLLALTVRLEAYFFLTVMAGLHRACFYVVPFALTNDMMHTMAKDGKKNVGLAMSLVTASIPLSYCTLYPWIGSLEDFTGMVTIPMWIGSGCACVSALTFLCIGKV